MHMPHLLNTFLSRWTFVLGFFPPLLACMNNTAMNICVQVYVWTHAVISFQCIFRSEIAESYSNSV